VDFVGTTIISSKVVIKKLHNNTNATIVATQQVYEIRRDCCWDRRGAEVLVSLRSVALRFVLALNSRTMNIYDLLKTDFVLNTFIVVCITGGRILCA